jgi:hypothetical protein
MLARIPILTIALEIRVQMLFCLAMQKDAPYIDDEGNRYYNVRQASRIVTEVSSHTLWNWAAIGVTSFGFELDVKRQPMIHHARVYRHEARIHRDSRMLIPEARVLILKEILRAGGKTELGQVSQAIKDRLEVLAHSRGRIQMTLYQGKRPPSP